MYFAARSNFRPTRPSGAPLVNPDEEQESSINSTNNRSSSREPSASSSIAKSSRSPPTWSIATSIRDALVETMKALGLFGLNVPERIRRQRRRLHDVRRSSSKSCRAAGWGSPASSARISCCATCSSASAPTSRSSSFLPGLAKGEPRGGICLSEPNAGTDLQAITTTARPRRRRLQRQRLEDVGHQRPPRADAFCCWPRPTRRRQPPHRGISAFVIEKGAPGLTVSRDIDKLGYKTRRDLRAALPGFPGARARISSAARRARASST